MKPTWTKNVIKAIADGARQILGEHDRLTEAFADNGAALAKIELLVPESHRQGLEAIIERCETASDLIAARQEAVDMF